ncbi:hypothetical protein KSP40_PGU006832 [Platanthera guangdongensis]|uniref:Late embryogenesis abundant protein LEA-2 subgroup domain-containing protein n=1 Tax=Platanthera guangdongensis TaxID=2320717 RepID=A0ABR2MKW6_9ASPA
MDSSNGKQWIRRRRYRCLLISLSIFIFLVLLIVILAVTVFRIRDATTTVNSIKLGGYSTGLNIPNPGLDVNVTLDLDLTAHNPNRVSFRYGAGTADLLYRGEQVGDAAILPGEIGARSSERMNISLTIYATKLIGETALYAEALSGSIDFQTTTRIPGRVTVMGIFRHHIVTYNSCNMAVNVSNRSVENSNCKYKANI